MPLIYRKILILFIFGLIWMVRTLTLINVALSHYVNHMRSTISIRSTLISYNPTNNRLSFQQHIDYLISRASKYLGFITRSSKDFKNPYSLITLFKTLVVPTLTYASSLWRPSVSTHINKIEAIQRKFLRYLAFKSGSRMSIFDHNYSPISSVSSIYQL